MSMAIILSCLQDNSEGSTPLEIAEATGLNSESITQCLARLESRGQVRKLTAGNARKRAVWQATETKPPSIFRAEETLAAMQAACREKLTQTAETT